MVRDDVAEVPGAALRFRLTGKAGKYPLIVMENGWGASYDYFALLQARLAAKTQVLLYNRAGVGGSMPANRKRSRE
jgi:pimeloyl-ACP methyl ester carboxylesterase